MDRLVPAGVVRILDRRRSGAAGSHRGVKRNRSEDRRKMIIFSREN